MAPIFQPFNGGAFPCTNDARCRTGNRKKAVMPWRSRSAAAPLFLSAVCLLSKVNSDAFLDLPDNEIHILRDGFCSIHTGRDSSTIRASPRRAFPIWRRQTRKIVPPPHANRPRAAFFCRISEMNDFSHAASECLWERLSARRM